MINNKKISKFAISIVKDLHKNNFKAYLVGGCVRDLLCGINPKDFDIATDATPEQIRKIFRASRIIGKRFKLVHVFNRSELIEVATFRSGNNGFNDGSLVTDQSGKIIRDNVWGTLEDDINYTLWLSEVHNDASWGMSTSLRKMKLINAFE